MRVRYFFITSVAAGVLALGACAAPLAHSQNVAAPETAALLERVSWGPGAATLRQVQDQGWERYLAGQLAPRPAPLPQAAQRQIAALTISQRPPVQLALDMERRRKAVDAGTDDAAKKLEQLAYQRELNRLAREAASRSLLLALYSPNQLQQRMTWFWLNHFSVLQSKHNLRALVGDYEAAAIAPHALGKFRDLLGAVARHPAMLRYLDNDSNGAEQLNQSYARALMAQHTLGADGGYSQRDVQELARILTGVGVNLGADAPALPARLRAHYVRDGLFEFNPARHDYGDKLLLGRALRGRGLAELDEALDRLSRSPATARHIGRKLALFLVSDTPSEALVERLAQTFQRSDGDIAATLGTLFADAEFRQSPGHKFKDPMHYILSALRLAYDDQVILNTGPVLNWLGRLGQPLYGCQSPDGYPLTADAWSAPAQLNARFEIAREIGAGSAELFK